MVGRNAVGKTKVLGSITSIPFRVIRQLMEAPITEGDSVYDFDDDGVPSRYSIAIHDGKIENEEYKLGDEIMFSRGIDGKGKMRFADIDSKGKDLDIQVQLNEAVITRSDAIQHPYLIAIHDWARRLHFYNFSQSIELGHRNLGMPTEGSVSLDNRNTSQIITVFNKGVKQFPGVFTRNVIRDMKLLDYNIEKLTIDSFPPKGLATTPVPAQLKAIYVQEAESELPVSHIELSNGMFRALSVLIQVNYYALCSDVATVVIDDIGEGLDYERSKAFVKLLMGRAKENDIQLIMSTNDRFIMNAVPLEYWTVLERKPKGVRFFNHENAKTAFDEFKLTGLSNFDFFEMNFVHEDAIYA